MLYWSPHCALCSVARCRRSNNVSHSEGLNIMRRGEENSCGFKYHHTSSTATLCCPPGPLTPLWLHMLCSPSVYIMHIATERWVGEGAGTGVGILGSRACITNILPGNSFISFTAEESLTLGCILVMTIRVCEERTIQTSESLG